MNHHVTVRKNSPEDIEVPLPVGAIVGLLCVRVWAIDQDHLREQRDIQVMNLDRFTIEAKKRRIDGGVTGYDSPSRHWSMLLPSSADTTAQKGVEERTLPRTGASQETNHECPVQIDFGDLQPRFKPGDEALRRLKW
jgi:hypothetical protein